MVGRSWPIPERACLGALTPEVRRREIGRGLNVIPLAGTILTHQVVAVRSWYGAVDGDGVSGATVHVEGGFGNGQGGIRCRSMSACLLWRGRASPSAPGPERGRRSLLLPLRARLGLEQ